MLRSWFFRALITRTARAYGFMDPVGLLARLRGFAQPSEVGEPIELLRAGVVFHARGLVNTKAIQNNLDWTWPYWVERQFNPADDSFIPRAFSFSHINLTHRNWTAVGRPDIPYYPIVDPRGLVTPQFDGWSLDFCFMPADGGPVLFPSKLPDSACRQTLTLEDNLHVRTTTARDGVAIATDVTLDLENDAPVCCIRVGITGAALGHLVVALRPYNPEGVSAIDTIQVRPLGQAWTINGRHTVAFDRAPARHALAIYKDGDVTHHLAGREGPVEVSCPVGMASAAALFPAESLQGRLLTVRVPVFDDLKRDHAPRCAGTPGWDEALRPFARLRVSDSHLQRLYDLAIANLVLHSPEDVYPGPYTYKRFWFRDAALILNALLAVGGVERTRRALNAFAPRQRRRDGYFLSQEGEWDSNGEAIWAYHRFATLTGETLPAAWLDAVERGARWITRKRLPNDGTRPEAGLFPAGFSAEHLGPNDYYYWDDFWGVAGLRCASELLLPRDAARADLLRREADEFHATIVASFPKDEGRHFPGAIPAAPRRRMDSGAIGSIVADFPLQLFPPADPRIMKTVDYLRAHSLYGGGFFQNMIHSGINAYLTIHLAQVLLRAGDTKSAWELIDAVARLASPTGQWPEAIHPRTLGGCMGDGQHIWAAAEWVLVLRNCFVREEPGRLILGSGVRAEWLEDGGEASFGPTLTPYGTVTVTFLAAGADGAECRLDAQWRGTAPRVEIALPDHKPFALDVAPASVRQTLRRRSA